MISSRTHIHNSINLFLNICLIWKYYCSTLYEQNINYKTRMPMEDFEVKEDLGKGSFGSVVKVVRKSDGAVYAMKQVLP